MCKEEYKLEIDAGSSTIAADLFRYGFTCGMGSLLRLDCIRDAFARHCFSEIEESRYIGHICDGFASGIDYARKVRLN